MPLITKKQTLLAIEFFALCVLLPSMVIAFRLAPYMFIFLWGTAAYCWLILRVKYPKYLKTIWKWEAVNAANLKPILLRWVFACIGMLCFIYLYDPNRMFSLLFSRPYFVPFLLILYPLLSALPQEFIFCGFFFKRYEQFFKTERSKIIASTIVFAFAHMLFINWVAPTLSLIAGIIFAHTYSKTRSLALVTIEHGLYGNFLFIVGLGWYFYGGAVAQM